MCYIFIYDMQSETFADVCCYFECSLSSDNHLKIHAGVLETIASI